MYQALCLAFTYEEITVLSQIIKTMCDVDEQNAEVWGGVRGDKNVQRFRRLLYPGIGCCQVTLYYTNSNMCIAQMCFQNGLETWGKLLLVNISRAESWLLKERPRSQLLNLDQSGIQISPLSENGALIPSQPNWTSTPRGASHADFSHGLRDNICCLKSQRDHFSPWNSFSLGSHRPDAQGCIWWLQSSHAQPTLDVHVLF